MVAVLFIAIVVALILRPTDPVRIPAVVLSHTVTAGQTLSANDLMIRPIAAEALPEQAFTHSAEAATGLRTVVDLPAGTVLSQPLLSRSGLGSLLPPGRVAVAVPTQGSPLVGALVPGDLVNLFASLNSESQSTPQPVAVKAIVLPRGLLATGDSTASPEAADASLLVAVTASEAQALAGMGATADVGVVLVE